MVNISPDISASELVDKNGPVLTAMDASCRKTLFGSAQNPEQFLAEAPCVVYECDVDLRVTCISPNAVDVIGIASKELVGSSILWKEMVFNADRADLFSRLKELKGGEKASLTHRLYDRCGFPIWVSHSFTRVESSAGDVIRGCLVPLSTENCTRNIDAEIVPQFVHKIGNHFQLTNLLIGNLQRYDIPIRIIDSLQQALDETVEFTRKFLSYAQAASCQSDVELGEVLKAAIESMLPAFADKLVSFREFKDDLVDRSIVRGDPSALEVAFREILQNALDATKAHDEVRVNATCEAHPEHLQGTVKIVILDTGCGMDAKISSHAAEPFFSSHRDRGGLGLSTAVRIVEQHGGEVRISSAEGCGTQVEVVLPSSMSRSIVNSRP